MRKLRLPTLPENNQRLRLTARSVSLVALLLVFVGFATPPVSTGRTLSDADFDGIDDDLEAQAAATFLPQLRYHGNESQTCLDPSHNPIVFRARHPSYQGQVYTDYVAINYVRLFRWDCGPLGHDGDNEPFNVFLRYWDGAWRFDSTSAIAHMGTGCQEVTASASPMLWVGLNKHGIFAQLNICESGAFCNNHCMWDGPGRSHTLYNVGEPSAWLLNDLSAVDASFNNETVWNDDRFMSAGVSRISSIRIGSAI